MKTYRVEYKEVVTYQVDIKANSGDEAISLLKQGEFEGEKITERELYDEPEVVN